MERAMIKAKKHTDKLKFGRFLVGLLLLVSSVCVSSQVKLPLSSNAKTSGQQVIEEKQNRAPLPHLYWHFLMYQNHLDQAAVDHEKQGKDGSWLRNHFEQKLGFSDAEFAPVRTIAHQLESEMKPIDAQITTIALQDHAWLQLHGRSLAGGPPPGHTQVHQLSQAREVLIQSKVDSLNQALGAKNASKLQYFIENEWAPNVTLRTIQKGPRSSAQNGESHKAHPWQEVRP